MLLLNDVRSNDVVCLKSEVCKQVKSVARVSTTIVHKPRGYYSLRQGKKTAEEIGIERVTQSQRIFQVVNCFWKHIQDSYTQTFFWKQHCS